ncbi:MAG: ribonuclease Z [Bacteroidetes bacterium]|nr:ribonuclease Z [Bacteroidota bacterium]MDA0888182.1 ribonuclease Z [Bacteroidota bacterium]MDA1084304.1 ribonuclease Z [Bacteroidota bacterium]
MKLTILGCHSASPHEHKNPTAQLLDIKGHRFLIDCGEGTQVQLRKSKVSFVHIKHIFISHLHGDHFYGLPGLVSSFRLLGREAPLHIYGPEGIKEALTLLLKLANSRTNFPLHFHELESKKSECVYEDDSVVVYTVPLDHRVYTNGFLFAEKEGMRRINADAAYAAGIDKSQFRLLQLGQDVLVDGDLVKNSTVTQNPHPPKKYAYCSDTAFLPSIIPIIQDADWLYHEATFLQQHANLAQQTKHSTAQEAATIARDANVQRLILGHYSSRYKNLDLFAQEAKSIFNNVILASDGAVIS